MQGRKKKRQKEYGGGAFVLTHKSCCAKLGPWGTLLSRAALYPAIGDLDFGERVKTKGGLWNETPSMWSWMGGSQLCGSVSRERSRGRGRVGMDPLAGATSSRSGVPSHLKEALQRLNPAVIERSWQTLHRGCL